MKVQLEPCLLSVMKSLIGPIWGRGEAPASPHHERREQTLHGAGDPQARLQLKFCNNAGYRDALLSSCVQVRPLTCSGWQQWKAGLICSRSQRSSPPLWHED